MGDRRHTLAGDAGSSCSRTRRRRRRACSRSSWCSAPVSGGHFNPVVSLVDASFGGLSWRDALAYIPAQVLGCVAGAIVANVMFALAAVSMSTNHRASEPSARRGGRDARAAPGDLLARAHPPRLDGARRVGAYIGAAYFFTSSTSFANPAITVGRMFSDTFAGIAPARCRLHRRAAGRRRGGDRRVADLYPAVTPGEAAEAVLPHDGAAPARRALQQLERTFRSLLTGFKDRVVIRNAMPLSDRRSSSTERT